MKSHLAQYFVQSWTFSASMETVALCANFLPSQDPSKMAIIEAAQAELLDLALSQVCHSFVRVII
jgi:hypothetical protein